MTSSYQIAPPTIRSDKNKPDNKNSIPETTSTNTITSKCRKRGYRKKFDRIVSFTESVNKQSIPRGVCAGRPCAHSGRSVIATLTSHAAEIFTRNKLTSSDYHRLILNRKVPLESVSVAFYEGSRIPLPKSAKL
jgi:hypothetical protein